MQESTTPTATTATPAVQVPAELGHRALLRARKEVDRDCQLLMTSDTGMVALVLPDRLRGRPETPDLELRLAAIARQYGSFAQVTDAGEMLADAARRTLGGSLAARTARRTEPGLSPRARPARRAAVAPLRSALL